MMQNISEGLLLQPMAVSAFEWRNPVRGCKQDIEAINS